MSVSLQIQPKQGENYSGFVLRAHQSLRQAIPNTYDRNQAVWDAWNSSTGNPLRSRAQDYFPDDQYRHVESVPYFMEHTIQKATGPLVYDFAELARMTDALNKRCSSDSYSALVSHHTDDHLKGPDKEPSVLGFSGPFYLGQVPTADGDKWAIFGDEHHDRQYSNVLSKRRRRSVEVLRPRNGDPSYFDPIATLGADSPRLPLPVARYESKQESDVECVGVYSINGTDTERYMMDGMGGMGGFSAMGQGNTFVPGSMQKDRYEPMQQPQGMQPGTGTSQLMPDDVKAIVNAIMQTPQMQWVAEQMEAGMGGNSPLPTQNPMQQSPMQQPPGPLPNQYAAPVVPSMGSPSMYSNQTPSQYSATSSQEDEMNTDRMTVERYAQIENELIETRDRYSELHAQNQQLVEAHKRLFAEHAETRKLFTEQQQKLVDADRYSQIKELANRYDLIDPEVEATKCLYSRGSKLSDDEFTSHLQYVEQYAARAANRPPVGMIPDGVAPSRPVDAAMEERINNIVVERFSAKANKGEFVSYDDLRAEVVKELGAA
jgi:hypothetical protein